MRISGVTVDITERKEAEERQALLAREVDHRARNALALVQSIVRLTRADTTKSYIAAVEGRIGALVARAYAAGAEPLAGRRPGDAWPTRSLRPTAAATPRRSWCGGPDLSLEPRAAQTLALALHELSTNAAKYGALSEMSGRVTLTWDLTPDRLVMRWVERDGPPVAAPASPGFGIRVISASVERQLEGEATFDWRPEGLHCTLSVPRGEELSPLAHDEVGRASQRRRQVGAAVAARDRQPASCWSRTRSWSR